MRAMLGAESFPYMKFLIIFVKAVSIDWGIPWAFVRNWVHPPTTACTMVFRPYRVG